MRLGAPRSHALGVASAPGSKSDKTTCPHAVNCPLYPQFTAASLLSYWKACYCESTYSRCARYRLSAEGQPVPLNLLPSGNFMKLGK